MNRKRNQNIKPRYHDGTIPIPDTEWIVEIWDDEGFEKNWRDPNYDPWKVVGWVFVSGKEVGELMRKTQNIADNMPAKIAYRKAREKYPQYWNKSMVVKDARYWSWIVYGRQDCS